MTRENSVYAYFSEVVCDKATTDDNKVGNSTKLAKESQEVSTLAPVYLSSCARMNIDRVELEIGRVVTPA